MEQGKQGHVNIRQKKDTNIPRKHYAYQTQIQNYIFDINNVLASSRFKFLEYQVNIKRIVLVEQ